MTTQDPREYEAAPRRALLLPAALLAHQCEEWWGGPGFVEWIRSTLGADLSPARFLVINAIGLTLFTAAVVGAVRSRRLAWLAAAFAALLFLNGTLHLLLTAAFGTYSPGTVTGALLFLPLGGLILRSMRRSLPRPLFVRALVAGIAVHALVTLAALS